MNAQTMQNDPNIKLPRAVREAAERADQIQQTMLGEAQPAADLSARPAGEVPPAEEPTAGGDQRTSAPPVTPPGNPAEPSQGDTDPKPAATPADDWEHKYKSLHGRFVRQEQVVREQAATIQNLEGLISTMQSAPAPANPGEEPPMERLITDEEAADYGSDFLTVVGKKAREELAPLIKRLNDENAELRRRLDGVSTHMQQGSMEQMHAAMDKEVPKWREMNTDPGFLEWLGLPDPYSGAIRHDMLKEAYSRGNAARTIAFFKGYLSEEAAVAPANAEPDTTGDVIPKVPLQNLAAPGRAKAAAAGQLPPEKPFISRKQITEFYADVAQGKYRGRDKDKAIKEAEIFAAQNEGRIT